MTTRPWLTCSLLPLLTACVGCHLLGSSAVAPPDGKSTAAAPLDPTVHHRAQHTHLVLASHADHDARASLLPVRIDGEAPELLPSLDLPTVQHRFAPDRFDLIAAHDGAGRIAVATRADVEAPTPEDEQSPDALGFQGAAPSGAATARETPAASRPAPFHDSDAPPPAPRPAPSEPAVRRLYEPGVTFEVRLYAVGAPGPSSRWAVGQVHPAALHLTADHLFVGQAARLSWIDPARPDGSPQELVHRPEMGLKAYDLFARDGDLLVAIDDVVMPIFADTIDLSSPSPLHKAGFELPGSVNGSYAYAALHRRTSTFASLYAIVPFHTIDGPGQNLMRLKLRDGAPLQPLGNLVLNSGASRSIPVIEEAISEHQRAVHQVVAGDRMTPWQGLAWTTTSQGWAVLVAAGPRGLLVFPDDFESSTRPAVIEVGGACLDVAVAGGRVWVLRDAATAPARDPDDTPEESNVDDLGAEPRPELVEIAMNDRSSMRVVRVTPLPGRPTRFLR